MQQSPFPPAKFAISVRGVCVQDGRVLLLQSDNDEWELPGGDLAHGEHPYEGLARMVLAGSGWPVAVRGIVDMWTLTPSPDRDIVVATYGCEVRTHQAPILGTGRKDYGLFDPKTVPSLGLADRFQRAIATWCVKLALTTV